MNHAKSQLLGGSVALLHPHVLPPCCSRLTSSSYPKCATSPPFHCTPPNPTAHCTIENPTLMHIFTTPSQQTTMGGGHHFEYPKWVWSPAGGWWPKPQAWKRNALGFTFMLGITATYLYSYATPRTIAYYPKKPPKASGGNGH